MHSSIGALFDRMSLGQNQSNHNNQSEQRKISQRANENSKTRKPPKARENAGDQARWFNYQETSLISNMTHNRN